jgi:L-tartrate/succinate antiporter
MGFLSWFAAHVTAGLSPLPVTTRLVLLMTVFFGAHYMFASLTVHTTALLPAFLAAGVATPDMPARPLALLLCYSIGLMGVLMPYATGSAPIYFGSGYVGRGAFWTLGGATAAFFLAVLLGLGVPWLLSASP